MRVRVALAFVCVVLSVGCCIAAGGLGNAVAPRKVWLSDLDISRTQQGWEHARKDLSVDGNPLTIAGRAFEKGLGTHADSIVASGLINHGWQYVNIDDCWMVRLNSDDPTVGGPRRDGAGRLLTNKRFPDMKALTD